MKHLKSFRAGLLSVLVCALTSCALLSRPPSLTTVQLGMTTPEQSKAWPQGLLLARVETTAVLASNRVIVIDGAKVMQFERLRWAQEPAVMLTEQLRIWQSQKPAPGSPSASNLITVSFTDFSIHLHGRIQQTVVVSASAELSCARSGSVLALGHFDTIRPLTNLSAQTIATIFSDASRETAWALLSAAQSAAAQCRAVTDLPLSQAKQSSSSEIYLQLT
jgi:ABC-type uncharacterized transport system auxiliary subunit